MNVSARNDAHLLYELQQAVERLADAMHDEPPIAGALRRYAQTLHPAASPPIVSARPAPMRDLLYRALEEGALEVHRFDWLMVAERRADRVRQKTAAK